MDAEKMMKEAERLWEKGDRIQSIATLEKLFKEDKNFAIILELFKKLEEMEMYERAYKVLEEELQVFDQLYEGHNKYEKMYAMLIMNI
jgi:RNA polymerase-interacting CarD/CdnL/TRCF family regulator